MATHETYDYFFHSPTQSIDGKSSTMTDEEKQFYQLLKNKTTSPGQLYVYYNSEITSRPGTFDHKHSAKGYAVDFSKQMPLHELSIPDQASSSGEHESRFLLSSRWFSHIAVVKVPAEAIPDGMRERDMKEIVSRLTHKLDGSTPGFEDDRQKLAASFMGSNVRKLEGTRDVVPWQAGISGHGHFAGLFKNKGTTLAGGSDSYYLAVHSDSDYLGEALNGYALKHKNLTLGQLAASPQMEGVRNYSERNARRVLAELSEQLGLRRDLVPVLEDIHAYPPSNDQVPPELASSLYVDTLYNYLFDPIADGRTLMYYNTTARLSAFEQHNGRIATLKNAKGGISLMKLDQNKDYTVFRHNIVSGRDESRVLSHANPHAAIPIGLGRLRGDPKTVLALSKLTSDDAASLYSHYEWKNKESMADFNDSSHVQRSLNKRLYAYKPVDQSTRTMIEFTLGAKTEITDLKPVAVILPSSE